jgi:hypothetical protein
MRMLRSVLVSGAAVLAVGSVTLTTASSATMATASGRASHAAPSARFIREARASLVRFLSHHHPQVMFAHPGSVHHVNGITRATSINWSGYADVSTKQGAFTRVSASWTTPRVKCNREDQITSEWVGLDGDGTATVEQDGTIGWCFRSKAIYFTWFEMFPAGTVEVGKSLRPGDKITATVARTGTSYKLTVTDHTRKSASFSRTKTCAASTCLAESAEWIAERSAFANAGVAPLVNYTRWKVTGASVTANGHKGGIASVASTQRLTMGDATGTYALSTASGLTKGRAFTTTWHNSW